jgi:DNA-binding protein YbaB
MSNDTTRDRLCDVLGDFRDQLADISALQKKQAALEVDARVADDTVVVTVNARGQLIKIVIDNCYLDNHDFDELADHITEAAQTAAKDADRLVSEMLAPINARHAKFPSLSDIVEGLPEPRDLMPPGLEAFGPHPQPQQDPPSSSADGLYDDGGGEAGFPTVRR